MGIIQQASGTFSGNGSFSPTLPAASSATNLVVVIVAGNTVVATPAGWTLRTSQVNWMGHYLWDRPGGAAAYAFSANGALTWWIAEISGGVFGNATSANNTAQSNSYSTPTLAVTAGQLAVASIAGDWSGAGIRTTSGWTNGYTEVADVYVPAGDFSAQGVADTVTTGTTTSTSATYSSASFGRSAVIAAYDTSSGAPQPVTATAALAGSGTLSASRAASYVRTSGLTGVGALSATARAVYARTAAFAGTAQLTGTRQAAYARTTQTSGAGALAGDVAVSTTATLTGTGVLHADAVPVYQRTAALAGVGALTADRQPTYARAANLAGDGDLTSSRQAMYARTASLAGAGMLTAAGSSGTTRAATLAGDGALTATVDQVTYRRTALLSGAGLLTGDRRATHSRAGTFTADGTLAGMTRIVYIRAGQFTGAGTLAGSARAAGVGRDITATATLLPSPWGAALQPDTWQATTATVWAATITEAPVRTDSTEYLHLQVTSDHDITGDVVEISIDDGATWHACDRGEGDWRILCGPGALQLPAGNLTVLARVTDAPEIPVLDAGRIYVGA